ncbi:phosphotransferase [Streptomyces decoyicus]|uniref:phosphotransferase n=1 Tax=Streptomyces decoyicus TaxID=249567 RepID=UPI0033FFDB23
MYSPPTTLADERRALAAQQEASAALGVTVEGRRRWGYEGRTLGQKAHHPGHGACWLRLISAPAAQAKGKLWEGTKDAAVAFPGVRKPALYGIHDGTERDGTAYRAELTAFIDSPTCAPEPVLTGPLELSETWRKSLHTDLETIAATPTERVAVRRQWIDRALPQHAGVAAPAEIEWATAHGDCHFANLTTSGPTLLDFEGFGLAPIGYDPALLYAYSLLAPQTADRIRAEFPILDSRAGHTALLVVAADLLQSASRGDHPELTEPLRTLITSVTH